ncbi:MAG TPA: choice-of-anchor V domain-containing protein [Bacteroidales bacterium]|nr:choice-of-anchor V domain-containing protein [Bacteroidales bacterium]
MKKAKLFHIPITFIILILAYGFGGGSKYPGGSPGGYTGSPGDSKNCTYCHGGSAGCVLGWISSDIPDQGYMPGQTYTIAVTVSGTGDKGFEVSPQSPDGTLLGTLHDGTGIHLVNGSKAATHDNSSSANPKTWQFDWTAPDAGTGEVTFYGAFTVNEPVTKLCTLVIQEDLGVSIPEEEKFDPLVFPNPATDEISINLNVPKSALINVSLISTAGGRYELLQPQTLNEGIVDLKLPICNNVAPGIYILYIQLGEQVNARRIIVL